MRPHFPLFQSHLDVAHHYWKALVKHGDLVIDATCGNGNDTLILSQLALTEYSGTVYALDIQDQAIEKTKSLLNGQLCKECYARINFLKKCHSTFPESIQRSSAKLIVYNLGYLPGANKEITTRVESTLKSLECGLELLKEGGMISITCYPGHPEGKREESALIKYLSTLNSLEWSCSHQCWVNRKDSPSLLCIQKRSL